MGWAAKRVRIVLLACGVTALAEPACTHSPCSPLCLRRWAQARLPTGFACTPIVLAWGKIYRDLDARRAVLFTSMTFLGAALLYRAIMLLGSTMALVACRCCPFGRGGCCDGELARLAGRMRAGCRSAPPRYRSEIRDLVRTALSWRDAEVGADRGVVLVWRAAGVFRLGCAERVPRIPRSWRAPSRWRRSVFFVYGALVSRTSPQPWRAVPYRHVG